MVNDFINLQKKFVYSCEGESEFKFFLTLFKKSEFHLYLCLTVKQLKQRIIILSFCYFKMNKYNVTKEQFNEFYIHQLKSCGF